MPLSKDAILTAADTVTEEVHVPEWADPVTGDDVVVVRGMTGRERDEWEQSLRVERDGQEGTDYANVRAKVVAKCAVGVDGERLFTDSDVHALGEKSVVALERVYDAAARLSGLREADVKAREPDFTTSGSGSSSTSLNGLAQPSAVS